MKQISVMAGVGALILAYGVSPASSAEILTDARLDSVIAGYDNWGRK